MFGALRGGGERGTCKKIMTANKSKNTSRVYTYLLSESVQHQSYNHSRTLLNSNVAGLTMGHKVTNDVTDNLRLILERLNFIAYDMLCM